MRVSRGFGCVALCLAALGLGGVRYASAANASSPIKINVYSIEAQYPDRQELQFKHAVPVKMDPKLNQGGLADRLRMMFDYSEYTLIKRQSLNANCGGAVAFNLPVGHVLYVAPVAIENDELSMVLAMFEGTRMIMRVPFRLAADGILMLVGQHAPNRFYITAVSAENPQLRRHAQLTPIPLPPISPVQPFPVPAFIPPW